MATVHLISQEYEHDTAWIVGTESGLRAVRAAIDRALSEIGSGMADLWAYDGEGFRLVVAKKDDMSDVPHGYTGDPARQSQEMPLWLLKLDVAR